MECGFSVLLLLLLLFFPLYSSEEVIKSTIPKAYLRVQKKTQAGSTFQWGYIHAMMLAKSSGKCGTLAYRFNSTSSAWVSQSKEIHVSQHDCVYIWIFLGMEVARNTLSLKHVGRSVSMRPGVMYSCSQSCTILVIWYIYLQHSLI